MKLMRHVYVQRTLAHAKGVRARATMQARYSHKAVLDRMMELAQAACKVGAPPPKIHA
jgi:hypothetical protein